MAQATTQAKTTLARSTSSARSMGEQIARFDRVMPARQAVAPARLKRLALAIRP